MLTRVCTRCRKELPATLEYYGKENKVKSGLTTICRECISKQAKQYFIQNKQKIKDKQKEWRDNNKLAIKIKRVINYQNKRDKRLDYYRKYYQEHKDYFKQYDKQYIKSDKGRMMRQTIAQKRRTLKKNVEATLTSNEWRECLKHFNNQCAYCGTKTDITDTLTQDHFIPLSSHGEYTINNIVPACRRCNGSKSDNRFFEWYPRQPFYSKQRENKILRYLSYDKRNGCQQIQLVI